MIQQIRRLSRFEAPTALDWLIYFAAFSILHIPGILNFYSNNGVNNPYLLFAESLMHGNLTLPPMSDHGDMIFYQGQYYLPYPPFPSLLLLPFVAIFGEHHVNTVLIALLMTCLNLYLMYRIFAKLQIRQNYIAWLIGGFFLGTGYWYALFTSHHVYAFAHITSCMCQLLVLNELLGKRRWWLVGAFIGCSFLTRQFTIFYIILALGFMWYLHKKNIEKIRTKDVLSLLGSFNLFILIYLIYNYLRFGNPLDTGYAHIIFITVLKERVDQYGVFSPRYFLFNLYSFLFKGFNIEFQGPGLLNIKDMDLWGTSLLSASPFVIASLKAEWPKTLKVFSWITIGCILLGTLFYHNNGFHQVNTMRFSLDFLPLLFVLTALGAKHLPEWLFKGMVGYAILLNLIGFTIHLVYQR
jgi:4-amino-4-deoxy-L-arabinose transferase-like glycosyltransferase